MKIKKKKSIKNHLLVVMGFWSQKIWTHNMIKTSQNRKNIFDSHSKFVIGTQYIM